MSEFWKIWKYALGSFNDETTKKYDNWICIIRTLVMVQLILTNCFIIAGNIRHWNDLEKDNKISVHFLSHDVSNRLLWPYRNEKQWQYNTKSNHNLLNYLQQKI